MGYPANLDAEDKWLLARIEEFVHIVALGKRDSCFSPFLSEHQLALAQPLLEREHTAQWMVYGGYPDAERKMAGLFSPWAEAEVSAFPISVLDIHLPRDAEVSHRDVLGSLMALQIKRETIGDILTEPERRVCHVFLQQSVARFVCDALERVARYGVHCVLAAPGEEYTRTEVMQPIYGTVKSARMDALVSLLTGLSREKGAALIQAERVQCNGMLVRSLSAPFLSGDVITIRGYGKYKVEHIGDITKKGRLSINCSKFGAR